MEISQTGHFHGISRQRKTSISLMACTSTWWNRRSERKPVNSPSSNDHEKSFPYRHYEAAVDRCRPDGSIPRHSERTVEGRHVRGAISRHRRRSQGGRDGRRLRRFVRRRFIDLLESGSVCSGKRIAAFVFEFGLARRFDVPLAWVHV